MPGPAVNLLERESPKKGTAEIDPPFEKILKTKLPVGYAFAFLALYQSALIAA